MSQSTIQATNSLGAFQDSGMPSTYDWSAFSPATDAIYIGDDPDQGQAGAHLRYGARFPLIALPVGCTVTAVDLNYTLIGQDSFPASDGFKIYLVATDINTLESGTAQAFYNAMVTATLLYTHNPAMASRFSLSMPAAALSDIQSKAGTSGAFNIGFFAGTDTMFRSVGGSTYPDPDFISITVTYTAGGSGTKNFVQSIESL